MAVPQGMITGNNLIFNGGTYIQHIVPPEGSRDLILQEDRTVARTQARISFDKLAGNAFPRAFHLADADPSHSTCFPNTRIKILERIQAWALRAAEKDAFIMWLHGAAGGGKTSIARTFAKWCDEEQGILLGEFFFSRADGVSNQFASLAPTLAYRMAVHTLKDAKDHIANVISHDPHIFSAPLAEQFKKLVLEPLDTLTPNGITPHVIILDGLDETLTPDEQETVLETISKTLFQHNPTLRILICSRTEPAIVTTFNDNESCLNGISAIVSLNDDVDSDTDIRRFLVERFVKIKKQLPYPPKDEWPTRENIDYLVRKSSGQFIFAATVDKYVGSPKHRHLAVTRLKHVLDLSLIRDPKKSPFSDLDALYSLILSTRSDDKLSARVMAICIQYPKYFNLISPTELAEILQVGRDEIWAVLYELGSLLDVGEVGIRPFHASFEDFLYDKTRSHDFHCVLSDIVTDITKCYLLRLLQPDAVFHRILYSLLTDATLRKDLRDILDQMKLRLLFRSYSSAAKIVDNSYYLVPLLRQLETYVSPNVYKLLLADFDINFLKLLSLSLRTFNSNSEDNNYRKPGEITPESPSSTSKEDESGSLSRGYDSMDIALLIGSPIWDQVKTHINVSTTRMKTLHGFCDEAPFVRSHLPQAMSFILSESSQKKAALVCLRAITSEDIGENARAAFIDLFYPSLVRAKLGSMRLETRIENLISQHPTVYNMLPSRIQDEIQRYLAGLPSSSMLCYCGEPDCAICRTD